MTQRNAIALIGFLVLVCCYPGHAFAPILKTRGVRPAGTAVSISKNQNPEDKTIGGSIATAGAAIAIASALTIPQPAEAAISGGRIGANFTPRQQPPAVMMPAPESYRRGYSRGYSYGYSRPRLSIDVSPSPYYFGSPSLIAPSIISPIVPSYGYGPYVAKPYSPYGGYSFGRPGIGFGLRFMY